MASELLHGYQLVEEPPLVEDYLALRERAGLSLKTQAQAVAGLPGAWAACHVIHELTNEIVGMGRVVGDGGWYFHIMDMAVIPEHQRRGLGAGILALLLRRIRENAPPGATISLLADPPGRRLYERFGFTASAPGSIGMVLRSS